MGLHMVLCNTKLRNRPSSCLLATLHSSWNRENFTSRSFRQRRRNGLFRVSWGTCLLLSVLAHLFLLAGSCLVPEEWLASPRPAEAARRKVAVSARMVKKVEPQLESRRQEPAEYLPAVVKTNEEQESATRPEVPKFQSNRNTRAEGGRKDPDGDRDMPAQDGVERENGEIVLFNQECTPDKFSFTVSQWFFCSTHCN